MYDLILDIDNSETTKTLYEQEMVSVTEEYKRQRLMITGEGLTFFTLLLIGVYRLRLYLVKEIRLVNQQRNFLLSITHELKSPLASTKLNLQTIKRHQLDAEKQGVLLDHTAKDMERLEEMVNKLLLAARMDSGEFEIEKTQVDLHAICKAVVDKFQGRLLGHELNLEIREVPKMDGNSELLEIMLANLLENAIKYSPGGSKIVLSLFDRDKEIELSLSDEGMGISQEERENIFKKFYRIGQEDTRTSTGTGIGLFVVKEIVEMHRGKITLENHLPKGSVFKVFFNV